MAEAPIVVFGAGAVGAYLGGKLALSVESPSEVTLVGRERFVEAVRSQGLVLRDGEQDLVSHPAVTESPDHAAPASLIILTVRGYDVSAAIPSIRAIAAENSMVLAMQNGVGCEELLIEAFGPERVLVGTITTSVSMDVPGTVVRNGKKGGLALSAASGSAVPDWVVQRFQEASLSPSLVPDYRSLRWSKLLLNLPGAATTAILDCDMETVMNNPSLFRLEQMAFREAARMTDKGEIRIVTLPDYPAPLMKIVMRLPSPLARRLLAPRLIRSRGGRPPSMRADLKKGRTEIDFLNGAVVHEAKRNGIETPVNAILCDLIRALSTQPEPQNKFRARPQALLSHLAEQGVRL